MAENVPTKYFAARILLAFLNLFGWAVLIIGVLLFFNSAGQMFVEDRYGEQSFNPGSLFTLGPAAALTLGGLIALANVQLTRAAIDSADINREMLRLMRGQG